MSTSPQCCLGDSCLPHVAGTHLWDDSTSLYEEGLNSFEDLSLSDSHIWNAFPKKKAKQ